jgi:hypothetical protein
MQILIWRDLISRNQMVWKLNSETGLQFWKACITRHHAMTSVGLGEYRQNIKTSAKEDLRYYKIKQHRPLLMKNASNY